MLKKALLESLEKNLSLERKCPEFTNLFDFFYEIYLGALKPIIDQYVKAFSELSWAAHSS